jgi:hypothetical protein
MKKVFVISSGLIPVNWKPVLKEIYMLDPHEIILLSNTEVDIKFPGLDISYDCISDNKERFILFHESLTKWINTDRATQNKFIINWHDQLVENMNIANNLNFKKVIVEDIIKSTKRYFANVQNYKLA